MPWSADSSAPSPAGRSIENLLADRPRRQTLTGFDPEYSDIVDYIMRCTHRIWEQKDVGLCRSHYAEDCLIHTLAGPVRGVEAVVANTLATLAAFPDRSLIGEDVIWSEDAPGLFHTSHRIVSLMTHLGDDAFGPATGRRAEVTTIADCLVRENRIVEEWLVRDNAQLVRQLGLDPWTLARAQAEADKASDPGSHAWRAEEVERIQSGRPLVAAPRRSPGDRIDRHAAFRCRRLQPGHGGEAAVCFSRRALAIRSALVWPGGWVGAMNQLTAGLESPRLVVDHWAASALPHQDLAVALRWSLAGRHTRPGVYGAPTGRDLLVLGVSHYKVRDERVVEDVTVFDELAMLRQLAGGLGA